MNTKKMLTVSNALYIAKKLSNFDSLVEKPVNYMMKRINYKHLRTKGNICSFHSKIEPCQSICQNREIVEQLKIAIHNTQNGFP